MDARQESAFWETIEIFDKSKILPYINRLKIIFAMLSEKEKRIVSKVCVANYLEIV